MRKFIALVLLIAVPAFCATTTKPSYVATNQSITITLTSLASNAYRGSVFLDNTANLDLEDQVYVKVKTNAAGTSATGTINIYAYGCAATVAVCSDGGIAGIGTNAVLTPTSPLNFAVMTGPACNAVANATTYICGPYSVSATFGGFVPAYWGIVIQNATGAALDASVGSASYDRMQVTTQ